MRDFALNIASLPWFPVFHPDSADAFSIQSLFVLVAIICAAILAVVVGMVAFCLWKFREPENKEEPPQRFGSVKLEIIWITIPTLAVAVICVATIMTMRTATAATTRPPDLIVRGHQWWWEVEYPKAGVITANEIHLPTGQKWLVQLDADDVIHDFWVPELARKIDMIPGVHRQIWLEADQPGVYEGECAEFCGAEHAWMRFQVIAQPPAEYAQWLAQQQQPRPAPASAEAMQGHALFSQMTCAACHAVEQTPNSVRIAPNLTHLASRQKLAAGVLENTPDHLFQWLKDPQKFKPGCRMPNLKLTDAQTRALVAYLEGTP